MSQYLNIYLKVDGKYVSISDYSRNTGIYEEFDAPYEKLRNYTPEMLKDISARLQRKIEDTQKFNSDLRELIDLIPKIEGAEMEEKISSILDYKSQIEDNDEEISQLQYYVSICHYLADVAEYYIPVYAGVEIGDPTDQDVI